MSYTSVVLSKTPFLFPEFKELAGSTAADSSGNGYDGTYYAEAVLGEPSPIETDVNARAVGNRVAKVVGAPAPVNAFSWGGWGLYSADIISAAGVICRDGQPGLNGSNFLAINNGAARAMISTEGTNPTTYQLAWALPAYGFYRLLVTRHLNVMRLYVNGYLRAFREDLPTGPITSADYLAGGGEDSWKFGTAGDVGGVWQADSTGACDLYDYALSAADELEIYEAALLNPPIAGRADLRFNCYLEVDDTPTPVLFPFRPDWSVPVRETLAWLTDVRTSRQDYEQRAAVRQRPRRSLDFQALVLDNAQRRRFRAYLFAHTKTPLYLALPMDETPLTADAPAASSSLDFDSEFLDFNDGGKLALYEDENNFEIVEIDTVGDESTTLAGETANPWTTKTSAIPVVRALVEPIEIIRLTDSIEEAAASFRILAQDVPLAPHRLGTYSPRYTYDGLEVFDPFILGTNNWSEDGRGQVSVRAAEPESPAGIFSRLAQDTAAREVTSYSFFLDGRGEIAQFLAWWYSMKGRLNPIWVPTLQEDVDPISSSLYALTVRGTHFSDSYALQPARVDLAFVYQNETMSFRRISAIAPGAGQEVLTIDTPATLTNSLCVSFLKLSRLNEDTIELVWHTDSLVEVTVNFIDLLTAP